MRQSAAAHLPLTGSHCDAAGKQSLYLDTMDAPRLEKLKALETSAPVRKEEPAPAGQKPVFITPLNK